MFQTAVTVNKQQNFEQAGDIEGALGWTEVATREVSR